jgi:3-oxoacyl-(acyl-carrier-protein) synthase/NAD(P)-dependent dehydrogenase (short-subunit alcohol dehydrogenase family)
LLGVEGTQSAEELLQTLDSNAAGADQPVSLHRNGVRWTRSLEALPMVAGELPLPWRRGDVYLITGGAGGLGLVFAREIAATTADVTLILAGRSVPGEPLLRDCAGARIQYLRMDVGDRDSVEHALATIRREHGHLDGVIHSAGVIHDSFLFRKSEAQLRAVFAAKVAGVVNLDEATREDALRFFAVFSSATAVFGNLGQADYAAANAFMDEYVHCRARAVTEGRRAGHSVSINWPLWAQGGMKIDPDSEEAMHAQGLHALSNEQGITAFYQAFATREPQVVVLSKVAARIRAEPSRPTERTDSEPDRPLEERTLRQLTRLFAEVSGMPMSRIDAREPLEKYGIDSVMVVRLNGKLGRHFAELPKTLFFEYPSLRELNGYLIAQRRTECGQWIGLAAQPRERERAVEKQRESAITVTHHLGAEGGIRAKSDPSEPIAVIGLSGRYPQARTLDQYWENLRSGRDCIEEIPPERWDLAGFYCADVEQALSQRMSYCKWGGFIEGFSEFDPLFFNISPREAEGMDPQERLFLQACWEVMEDAGYTREMLATRHQGRVGIFAGITKTGFELYGPELWRRGCSGFPRTSFSSLANRVSYFLDVHGPSMPIDTMCSSSLTAIHAACESLLRDECELAIAGGVNLYLHPSSYVAMCAAQMLSATGRCRSFAAGADGMVPGEGVGTVLLKRLSLAIEHGDVIHAIVRGTGINHGGKTNGYTVPNPQAQRQLIRAALARAKVDPRTVSYMEAHGTGTELGDPIEIAGLTQAFQQDSAAEQFCAIGSAKSNIGHLEAAAGIASLTKVLLQMRHRTLVPSLHALQANPHIDFAHSPFRVQQEAGEWRRPVVTIDGETREYPRIAGISSFGAGGANAHVVLEEYALPAEQPLFEISAARPAIIVLSAKDEERLRQRVQQLLLALDREAYNETALANIAYTLQVGREAMEQRLAILVSSVRELREKLNSYLHAATGAGDFYRSEPRRDKQALAVLEADEDTAALIAAWAQKGKYDKLADLWVKGLTFDWSGLYGEIKPRRISLPTYPFARDSYWISELEEVSAESRIRRPRGDAAAAARDASVAQDEEQGVSLKSQWQVSSPMQPGVSVSTASCADRWVVFVGGGQEGDHSHKEWTARIEQEIPGVRCLTLQPVEGGMEVRFTEYAVRLLAWIRGVLSSRPQRAVLIQLVISGAERDEHSVLRGLGALLKTAQMENPRLIGQVIEMEGTQTAQSLLERLAWDASRADEREIRYRDGHRWVVGLQEVEG